MEHSMNAIDSKFEELEQKLSVLEREKHEAEERAKRSSRFIHRGVIFLLSVMLLGATALGASGYLMAQSAPLTYSGYLEEKGTPVNGKRALELSLWLSQASTNATNDRKCLMQKHDVDFVRGRFKTKLSSACESVLRFYNGLWVEVRVWDKAGMTSRALGRTQLGAVPTASYQPLFQGLSPSPNHGNMGGWIGAQAKCRSKYGPTAHMCTGEEILRSLRDGVLHVKSFPPTAYVWFASASHNIYQENNKTYKMTNCGGWWSKGTGTIQGMVLFQANGREIGMRGTSCDKSYQIACCR